MDGQSLITKMWTKVAEVWERVEEEEDEEGEREAFILVTNFSASKCKMR